MDANATARASAKAVKALLKHGARKATVYVSPTEVVKVTHRHGPAMRKECGGSTSVVLTYGPPNYAEREFIRSCRKAGEPFPVRKVQLKHWKKK